MIGDASASRRLVVLRHGETDSNAAGIWQGQLDHELSARGHAQLSEEPSEPPGVLGRDDVGPRELGREPWRGVADGEPVWYLVPDGVVQYINKYTLYTREGDPSTS